MTLDNRPRLVSWFSYCPTVDCAAALPIDSFRRSWLPVANLNGIQDEQRLPPRAFSFRRLFSRDI